MVTAVERPAASATKSRRLSLSSQIAVGIGGGIVLGLFLGELVAPLQLVADAYIKLLQMTVLPYVTVSIIAGLGSLTAAQARTLGTRVGIVLGLLWAVAMAAVVAFPLMFPQQQNASFFSTALLEDRERFDFLNLYIPTNPFYSLANNIVPAVVLFSFIVGVALIGLPDKDTLLTVLKTASRAVSRATNFVVALTPIGVFAIAAVVAGTLSFEELERLEVYLVTYVGMSLFLSLWVLPGLVAALTPIPYRALMSRSRDALILAFMTTSLFAVLPLLTEDGKELVREHSGNAAEAAAATDVIVPASFNFPHTGKILSLSFVLFAGWTSDAHVPLHRYAQLVGTGLFAMFGNVNAAIPYLLDLFRIPADTFQLFVTSGIVNARFGTLLAAVHTLTIATLGTCAVTGAMKFDPGRLARFAVITTILTVAVIAGTRITLQAAVNRPYTKDALLMNMGLRRDGAAPSVFRAADVVPDLPPVRTSILTRVHERGALRVGYFDDSLPYVFFNARNELVGFDVEMALQMARDLGVRAELVPVPRTTLEAGLDPARCDIVMSGVAVTADRSLHVQFSSSYLDETVAFVVPDHLMAAFSDWSAVRRMGHLRIGVPSAPYFIQKIRDELSDVEIVPVDRIDEMFAPRDPPLDAVVVTAERGSAYTLLHPQYAVAVPRPRPFKVPLAYIVAGRDAPMTSLMNTWIELKRKDGTIDQLFSHWILGQDAAKSMPRWSVVRNVLHWMR